MSQRRCDLQVPALLETNAKETTPHTESDMRSSNVGPSYVWKKGSWRKKALNCEHGDTQEYAVIAEIVS